MLTLDVWIVFLFAFKDAGDRLTKFVAPSNLSSKVFTVENDFATSLSFPSYLFIYFSWLTVYLFN